MAGEDKELAAIGTIMTALQPLTAQERSRVLEYVLKRLQMSAVRPPSAVAEAPSSAPSAQGAERVVDIRSLREEKQPRSANEMAALVAYYVSELAPTGERRDTVSTETLRRYFKMAGFRLPQDLRYTLANAAAAGYLDNVSRGEYRLNPVGYNLIVHGLPRGAGKGSEPRKTARRPASRKATRRKRGKGTGTASR
jgi:hypothetical protein